MSDDKLRAVLDLIAQGLSREEVAERLGYRDPGSVSQFLRRRGYRWDESRSTYVPDGRDSAAKVSPDSSPPKPPPSEPDVPPEVFTTDAKQLLRRAGEVLSLLDAGKCALADSLASPLLRGPRVVKGFRLPLPLDQCLEMFAAERRLPQQDVLHAALIEFLQRRGGSDAVR